MARYGSPPTPQMDGSTYQESNCTWAATNDHLDSATLGRVRPGPATLRRLSGDTSGGSTYTQNAEVAARYGVVLKPKQGLSRTQFRDLVAGGQRESVSIWCKITRYTTRRTGYFTGFHTVFANDYRWCVAGGKCLCEKLSSTTAHAEFSVEDPGTTTAGYLWWSGDLLYRAAEARSASLGLTGIIALAGPDTEGVNRVARESGPVRAIAAGSGAILGYTTKGQSFYVASTTKGGNWDADGTGPGTRVANGWAKTKLPSGQYGYATGRTI